MTTLCSSHNAQTIRRQLLAVGVGCLLLGEQSHSDAAVGRVASAQSAVVTTASTAKANPPRQKPSEQPSNQTHLQQSQQQMDKVVYGEQFSKAIPQTRWERKNPKQDDGFWQTFWETLIRWLTPSPTRNGSLGLGVIFALIVKGLLLLALLGGVIWLLIRYQTWLPHINRRWRRRGSQQATITMFDDAQLPLWHDLPPNHQLVAAVQQAITQQAWQQALSLLYRGTLREVATIHDLPITHATTEQQCVWLLNHSKHQAQSRAKTQPDEAVFLQELIKLWLPVVYGKITIADSQSNEFRGQIEQLLSMWQRLYVTNTTSRLSQIAGQTAGVTA